MKRGLGHALQTLSCARGNKEGLAGRIGQGSGGGVKAVMQGREWVEKQKQHKLSHKHPLDMAEWLASGKLM